MFTLMRDKWYEFEISIISIFPALIYCGCKLINPLEMNYLPIC